VKRTPGDMALMALKAVGVVILFVGWAMLFTPLGPAVGEQLGWSDDSPITTPPADCNSQPWGAGC